MFFKDDLLRNDYSIEEAKLLQLKYKQIIEREQENAFIKNVEDINSVVGVDISYYRHGSDEFGVACAVAWNVEKQRVEKKAFVQDTINFSYKPGFLGFRECKLMAKSISRLSYIPDLIMCDGHGIIHPRNFGEAVQLGYSLNTPCIGVAKNPYIGYSKWKKMERYKGNITPIWAMKPKSKTSSPRNDLLGYAVCLNDRSKPVFISVGYKITLDNAVAISLATSLDHRQPEPLYMADRLSRGEVQKFLSKLKQEYDFKVT
jgi:deoxyribonuclease V